MNQDIINTLIGIGAAICGWVLRTIWQSMRDLQDADQRLTEKLTRLQVEIPKTYVTKEDFRQVLQEINSKLDRICERLENKQDRSIP
jgi:hypothetical protein